ncbi:MAG: Membrane protein of unknown function [Blastococcus sp.]|nr:Membrane protein of unknown function [Blastococcus sp.]
MGSHLFGPPLPAFRSMWDTGGRRGVTAAICVVVPLLLGTWFDRPDLGAAAALGAFTAVYGHALPYRRRAIVVAGVGLALTVAAGLGALTGRHPVALSLVCGVLAAAAAVATGVWRIGPPGPLGIVLVCGGCSALGGQPSEVVVHLLAAAGGAALAWCACMLPWLWDPTGPERRAVEAAERTVAAVERNGLGGRRPGAVATAVRLADVAVADGSRRDPGMLRRRLRELEHRFFRALPVHHGDGPMELREQIPPSADRWWHVPWVATAIRIGVGAAAAGLLATAVGLPNPYWAAATAVAVQLGTGARGARARAAHRVTGTVVGVLIAWLIIAADFPVGVQILLVGLLQLAVELLVAHKYGLAVAFITPLVLTLVHIGAPGRSGPELIGERLAETGIGIALALAVSLTLFRRAGSRRLPGAVGEAAVTAATAAEDPAADRRLHDALVALTEVAAAARAELFATDATNAWLQRGRWVADLGWGLLGARARGDDVLTGALADRIRAELGATAA